MGTRQICISGRRWGGKGTTGGKRKKRRGGDGHVKYDKREIKIEEWDKIGHLLTKQIKGLRITTTGEKRYT